MKRGPERASVDLLLDLRGSHRRSGVEAALRDAVRSGRLGPGAPLPSSRSLAVELGLARNTVAEAYTQLVAEGWLTARPGSGTRVAPQNRPPPRNAAPPGPPSAATRPRFDLRPGSPDLSAFPRSAWQRAARRALTAAPSDLLDYPDPRGLPGLRQALADYLARVRGVRATLDQIVICSGFQQALHLLASTLRAAGAATIAVESYGHDLHRELIRAAGLTTAALAVDSAGARTETLAGRNLAGSAAALLTPAHQFPLGVALSADRRSAALRWARDHAGLLIEDDYDGEFRYDRKPIGAIQGLAPDLVAYVGTASKTLAPGLGLAWLVVPPRLLEDVIQAKRHDDGYTGVFEQLTLEEFIRSGAYDRHVRQSRLRYRRRRDQLLAGLRRSATPTAVTGIAAGLHAVVELRGRQAAEEASICASAQRAGLALLGLDSFRETPAPEAPAALVIGYGRPPEHAFAGALQALRLAVP